MQGLEDSDRAAVLLRYFENKSLREVGQALGTTEDAARKRVSRAVECLREFFARRGVTVGASGLAVLISAHAVQAAPAGLAATISLAAALVGTTLTTTATATAIKTVAMTTLQKTLIATVFAAVTGTAIYEAHQAARLRDQLQTMGQDGAPSAQQIAQLKADNESLSNQLARAKPSSGLSTERLRELLRLRGEVGMLRQRQRELEQTVATMRSAAPPSAGQSASGLTAPANTPAPFQVQLVTDEPGQDTQSMTNTTSGGILQVQKTPLLDQTAIRSVTVGKNSAGAPVIDVEFSPEGRELFAAVTRENINKRLALVLNGQVYSASTIRSEISGGRAQITGNFSEAEAKALAEKITGAVHGQ
jgi:preprotein translocase subunit SecD